MPHPSAPARPLLRRTLATAGLTAPAIIARPANPHPAGPWQVTQMVALTGGGALAGDAFRNGVEMAVQGINAAGGLFGRLVQTLTFDTQSSPQGARSTLSRVLEGPPLAVLGPVAPAETLAVAPLIRERRVLQIAAGPSTASGGPPAPGETLLLTSPSGAARMAMLGRWLATDLKIRRVALLTTPDHTEPAARLAAACRTQGLEVVADIMLPPATRGQPAAPREAATREAGAQETGELARVFARLQAGQPQALFIGAEGQQAARIIRAARQFAPGLALFGGASLVAPAIIAASGDAAIGVRGFASLTPDPPVSALKDFRDSFQRQFHTSPDPVSMQGYIALSMLGAAMQLAGAAALGDQATAGPALATALRAAPLTATNTPGLLLDTSWNAAGEPDRVAFIAEVLPGGSLGWSVVPPLNG